MCRVPDMIDNNKNKKQSVFVLHAVKSHYVEIDECDTRRK